MDSTFGRPKAGQEPYQITDKQQCEKESPVDSSHCTDCGILLTRDEIGLHKKLVNRGAVMHQCKKCLALRLHMTLEDCDRLIANFKADGCSLFF